MDLKFLRYLTEHPLNRHSPLRGLPWLLRWHLATRLLPRCELIVPLVNQARLVVTPGRWGSEANALCGLHEFADMGFLLHLLRPDDLFCDAGANIGTYTVLAAAAIGARSVAFEPVAASFADLALNVAVNRVEDQVDTRQVGLGRTSGALSLTTALDTMNHVVADSAGDDGAPAALVAVQALDEALLPDVPTLIKIDVEGWEAEVLAGAGRTLAQPGLLAVILELNGAGRRYGFDDAETHRLMTDAGFSTFRYRPFQRELVDLGGRHNANGNTLYVRDLSRVLERLRTAPTFSVRGQAI